MTWPAARTQLVSALAAVNITTPITETIRKVHEFPPATIQDWPCFIIYPPRREIDRGLSNRRVTILTVRCRLLVSDQDLDQAAEIVEAYIEATVDALDTQIRLGESISSSQDQVIEEAASFTYGDKTYTGFDMLMSINLTEARTLS